MIRANDPTWVTTYLDLADVPEDGGKWALFCVHEDGVGVVQDTNKRRLSGWLRHSEEWCPFCQEGAPGRPPTSFLEVVG